MNGRKTGAGAIALEVTTALHMPVIDIRKLKKEEIINLRDAFISLERNTR